MAESIDNIFSTFAISAVIIFSMIMFVISLQTSNDAAQPITSDSRFNETYVGLNESLSDLEGISTSNWNRFKTENPVAGFASIVMFTIVNIGKNFGTIVFSLFSLIIKFPLVVLGITPTISAVILAWVTITVIVSLWVLYKLGG